MYRNRHVEDLLTTECPNCEEEEIEIWYSSNGGSGMDDPCPNCGALLSDEECHDIVVDTLEGSRPDDDRADELYQAYKEGEL